MLKTRVIPTLLWKGPGLVKGVAFDSWRRIGTLLPAVKVYNTREVDELVLVDISATREGREPDYESLSEISAECFVPLTVGGGVNRLDIIRKLLLAGADKVVINSAAYTEPRLVTEASQRYGSQCIVVGIDAKKISDGRYQCFSHSGTKAVGQEPAEWAERMAAEGAGEILLTSIEKDGTMEGYDVELVRQVSSRVQIPVIASGGAGGYKDMEEVLRIGGASAVAAASIFHFTEQTPLEAKEYLQEKGIHVRLFGGSNGR